MWEIQHAPLYWPMLALARLQDATVALAAQASAGCQQTTLGALALMRQCLPRRVHKLQQKHAQRQKLAQRAQATAEDEIAWDDDTPGPSPATSPQQPAKTGKVPADKVRQDLHCVCPCSAPIRV